MRVFHILGALSLVSFAAARSLQHVGKSPNALPKQKRVLVSPSRPSAHLDRVKDNALKHRSLKVDSELYLHVYNQRMKS